MKALLAGLLLTAGVAAQAVPMTWSQELDFAPDVLLNRHRQELTYVHDIRTDGYRPGTDRVDAARLTVGFRDDGYDWYERAKINIVGRDHAGVGDYYGPYNAQHIFDELWDGALITQAL